MAYRDAARLNALKRARSEEEEEEDEEAAVPDPPAEIPVMAGAMHDD